MLISEGKLKNIIAESIAEELDESLFTQKLGGAIRKGVNWTGNAYNKTKNFLRNGYNDFKNCQTCFKTQLLRDRGHVSSSQHSRHNKAKTPSNHSNQHKIRIINGSNRYNKGQHLLIKTIIRTLVAVMEWIIVLKNNFLIY